MKQFLTFQDGVLKTICHIFKHENGKILHLLPVTHIGERRYYLEILEYIGEKTCIYESIEIQRGELNDNTEKRKTPKTFNEWLIENETLAQDMDDSLGREIKRFQRRYKILTLFIRRLRRLVKKNLGVADKRLAQFFHQLKRTNYSLHNITIQQHLLAEILELHFQYSVIDYENDIPNRKNWVHGDISIPNKISSNEEAIETFREILSHPSPEYIQLTRTNARLFYGMLYLIETLMPKSINERRAGMGDIFLSVEQKDISRDYVDGRNKIIIETYEKLMKEHNEAVILYGAAHMDGIKNAIEEIGFKLISTSEFIAFGEIDKKK